jgi:signal transduction histidine kinase
VLDLTQGDRKGVVLEKERIDMAGLVRAATETLSQRAAEKKQKLDIVVDGSTGVVIGDSRRLRESIEHVLRNAVSYTADRGKIKVSADGDEDCVTITVADNGPGISPEDQEQVFTRFHRVGGNARGDAAFGLGLPLTQQFVEAHGGRVELESALGKGTRVTLKIPRAPQ